MTVKNGDQQEQTQVKNAAAEIPAVPSTKKQFVQPEISQPVDVLEAIAFFQAIDSGVTN